MAEADEGLGRWDKALVAGPTTAPLGVPAAPMSADGRRIFARVGRPIYAGKSKYMLVGAGVSADFLAIETELTAEMTGRIAAESDPRKRERLERELHATLFAETVLRMACNYGFINIEDARGADLPVILGILEALRGECGVWSDDMMGTGVVTAMGMLAWAEHSGRSGLSGVRGVICGAGAGGYGVYKELLKHGIPAGNILVTDTGPERDKSGRPHPLHQGREDIRDDSMKWEMAQAISADTTVEAFLDGADFVINLGVRETLTGDPAWTERMMRRLAQNAIMAAMTNPDPGVGPKQVSDVRPDIYYASGDQTNPNAFNNFVAFSQMAAGVLLSRAGSIGPEMTVAAARGGLELARLGPPDWLRGRLPRERREFGRNWLVPHPEDTRLLLHEARAIAHAAADHGYSALPPGEGEIAAFKAGLDRELEFRKALADDMRVQGERRGRVFLRMRFGPRYDPVTLRPGDYPVFHVNPKIDKAEFAAFATRMGVVPERWGFLLGEAEELKPNALSTVLKMIVDAIQAADRRRGRSRGRRTAGGGSSVAIKDPKVAQKELELIVQIARLNPALGLALALRRTRVQRQHLTEGRSTVFHRVPVLGVVLEEIPRARGDIQKAFPDVEIPDGSSGVG